MNRIRRELDFFRSSPRSVRILLVSNMLYALVLPVIEIFLAAYVLRNSHRVGQVVVYQLSVYAATPVAFYLNGILLGRMRMEQLYGAGMLLSGMALLLLMRAGALTGTGIAVAGLAMGLATGLFWANRGFLALAATADGNRNYYYGVETFSATLAAVAVPALVGWFIAGTDRHGWLGGVVNHAYRWVAIAACGFSALAAATVQRGSFRAPPRSGFVFFRWSPLWRRMLQLALLKSLAQGYILTVPAMLVLLLVGKEGTLGVTQAIAGVLSAAVLYTVGRRAAPRHRQAVFAAALLLFFAGAVANAWLFNAPGVLVFIGCLALSKPLLDLGYNPIELRVIDTLAAREQRGEYAYFFNHELGLLAGRFAGCALFLIILQYASGAAALRYAMPAVALLQLLSIPIAGRLLRAFKPESGDVPPGNALHSSGVGANPDARILRDPECGQPEDTAPAASHGGRRTSTISLAGDRDVSDSITSSDSVTFLRFVNRTARRGNHDRRHGRRTRLTGKRYFLT